MIEDLPRLRPRAAALAALALAGCAAGGLPLTGTVAAPASPGAPVQGQAELVARAYLVDAAGARREVGGAVCEVGSILFSARLTTPARLVFPSYGPQSPTLVFDCAAGELVGRAVAEVAEVWVRAPGAWPGPGPWGWPYDGGWGAGWGWDAPAYVAFDYPDVAIHLR